MSSINIFYCSFVFLFSVQPTKNESTIFALGPNDAQRLRTASSGSESDHHSSVSLGRHSKTIHRIHERVSMARNARFSVDHSHSHPPVDFSHSDKKEEDGKHASETVIEEVDEEEDSVSNSLSPKNAVTKKEEIQSVAKSKKAWSASAAQTQASSSVDSDHKNSDDNDAVIEIRPALASTNPSIEPSTSYNNRSRTHSNTSTASRGAASSNSSPSTSTIMDEAQRQEIMSKLAALANDDLNNKSGSAPRRASVSFVPRVSAQGNSVVPAHPGQSNSPLPSPIGQSPQTSDSNLHSSRHRRSSLSVVTPKGVISPLESFIKMKHDNRQMLKRVNQRAKGQAAIFGSTLLSTASGVISNSRFRSNQVSPVKERAGMSTHAALVEECDENDSDSDNDIEKNNGSNKKSSSRCLSWMSSISECFSSCFQWITCSWFSGKTRSGSSDSVEGASDTPIWKLSQDFSNIYTYRSPNLYYR